MPAALCEPVPGVYRSISMQCKLCYQKELRPVIGADEREYYRCLNCGLVTTREKYFLSRADEKERYLQHNNSIEQPGYVEFLNQAIAPAIKYLQPDMLGLDYGCGYAKTLSELLERAGYHCENYDPFFVSNPLDKQYDYIFSTEVFEHFNHPRRELEQITRLLKTNGLLIVMTEQWSTPEAFQTWYYTRDPSHVAFYHQQTFRFLCEELGFRLVADDGRRVVILRKSQTRA